jgi:hypothetical protein
MDVIVIKINAFVVGGKKCIHRMVEGMGESVPPLLQTTNRIKLKWVRFLTFGSRRMETVII